MRIKIEFSSSTEIIPFNYQKKLTGCIHKWLGDQNELHGDLSLYCFSNLEGLKTVKGKGLKCDFVGFFFFSSAVSSITKSVIKGIQEQPEMFSGMTVQGTTILPKEDFKKEQRFLVASPVLVKRNREDGTKKHYDYSEPKINDLLTETLKKKMGLIGLDSSNVQVFFDKSYPNPKTKIIAHGKIRNKVSICPVIIKGTAEQIEFAYEVGVGNSTGIGFGALKVAI